MLYQYDGFRLYGIDGSLIKEVQFPDSDKVYDQQYKKDGQSSRLEVFYTDGMIRTYSAETGEKIAESQEGPPGAELKDEFITEQYRIVSEIHGTPKVYDRESGELLCTLQSEDYLTYAAQAGDRLVLGYASFQENKR